MREIKVLLTGATGFLGSNILKRLCNVNYDVIILRRSFSKLDNIEEIEGGFRAYNIDEISIESIFEKEKNIDIIIHCATNYGRNQEMPSTVLKSNLIFPMEILEIAARKGSKIFINTDTSLSKLDKVQGYMENYILSKKQFLEWGKLYAENKKLLFVNLVLEHIYGPGDDSSKFISYLIKSFKNEAESINLTAGEQYRDFIYIEDAVDAYLTVITKINEISGFIEFEVGTGNEINIRELVELIKELMDSNTMLNFGAIKYRENEVMTSKADISSLLNLGWEPKFDLKMGLRKYIKTY